MHCRLTTLLIVLILNLASSACLADDDPVKLKLDKAKAAYDAAMDKARNAVGEYFDKREEAARKDGNKKLVDEIKVERKAFDEKDEPPSAAPAALKQKFAAARMSMENAYVLAVKEYTKAKMDDEAAIVESELVAFKAGLPGSDKRRRWVYDKGEFRMTGKDTWEEKYPNGKSFHYKETARTKEYVQLDALDGNTSVRWRLYDTNGEYNLKPQTSYTTLLMGKWAK